jgi:hypothetical protein
MGRFIQLPVPPTPLLQGAAEMIDSAIATPLGKVREPGWSVVEALVEHLHEVHVL